MKKTLIGLSMLASSLFANNELNLNFLKPSIIYEIKKELELNNSKVVDGIQVDRFEVLSVEDVNNLHIDSNFILKFETSRNTYNVESNEIKEAKKDLYVLVENIHVDLKKANNLNPYGLTYEKYLIPNFRKQLESMSFEYKFDDLDICNNVYLRKAKENKKIAILYTDTIWSKGTHSDYGKQEKCRIGVPNFKLEKITKIGIDN